MVVPRSRRYRKRMHIHLSARRVLTFAAWSVALTGSAPVPPTLAPADLKADLDALYDGLKLAHFDVYAHRSQRAYDDAYRRAKQGISRSMSPAQAKIYFQRFVAYGRVAHATLDGLTDEFRRYVEGGGRVWGLDVRIDAGALFIAQTYGDLRRGDRIEAIDGRPTADVLAKLTALISADNDRLAHSLLERGFGFYLWLAHGEQANFRIRVVSTDGQRREVALPALTREQWRALPSDDELFSLNPAERVAKVLPDRIAYLRPGPFLELGDDAGMFDNRAFVAFIDQAFERFLKEKCRALIIDLRRNPGGDHSFSDPMISWFADRPFSFARTFRVRSSPQAAASNQARLDANPKLKEGVSGVLKKRYEQTPAGQNFEISIPKASPRKGRRFTGKVYVVVDRYSYSNAVNVAAIVQDYGFGEILGEKTADLATTYGAMESFVLPRTKIKVHFPKAHIVRPNGSNEADGVTPDVEIPMPLFMTKDMTLERVMQYVARR